MQPQNDQNQQLGNQPLPPPSDGAWDFLKPNEPLPPPKHESFFKKNKTLVIVVVVSFIFLISLTILAAVSSSKDGTEQESSNRVGTASFGQVATSNYDGEYFSMTYAQSLKVNIDESVAAPPGWFVQLAESTELSPYDIKIQIGDEPSIYESGEEAVSELLDPDIEPSNVVSSDISVAGSGAKKTVGEYTSAAGEERYVVYTTVQVGKEYIIISATYPKSNQDIINTFDAMVDSIRLKNTSN